MSILVYEHIREVHKEVKVKPYREGRGKTLEIYRTEYRVWSDGHTYAEINARDKRGKEYFTNNGTAGHFVATNGWGRGYHL